MAMMVKMLVKTVNMKCPQVSEGLRSFNSCESYTKLQVLCASAVKIKVQVRHSRTKFGKF